MRLTHLILPSVLIGLVACNSGTAQKPEEIVKTLYRRDNYLLNDREIDRFFAHDLAAALKKDNRSGEPGVLNDGDYRYDAQKYDISALKIGQADAEHRLAVTFKNFGEPGRVVYRFCLGNAGWKIADISSRGDAMRKEMQLADNPVNC